jgi:hypothetical protein
LQFAIRKRGDRELEIQPTFTKVGDDTIIGAAVWAGEKERFQVLTVRDGKIVDMQDCRSRREAERFARRR